MRFKSILATLLLMVAGLQTAWAQRAMKIWHNGIFELYYVDNVDSVQFVNLVTNISLSQEELDMKIGEVKQLTAMVYPVDADECTLTWESSSPNIASVAENGMVTAVSIGTAVITAMATDGSNVKSECLVTVTNTGSMDLLCPDGHHPHAIDLGLPSGTKWCCCNVGANTPEEYGGYYAWGETHEKGRYYWDTYAYYIGWLNCENIGSDIAGTTYDVATVRIGDPWRMPSYEQMQELVYNCSCQWTQQNGVNGILVTGQNGGQIFLPAAGYRWYNELDLAGSRCTFWSSSLYLYDKTTAFIMQSSSGTLITNSNRFGRGCGQSVRAVCP